MQKELGDRHAYQYAIHNPPGAIDGKEQPHAHIMFCERINDGTERDPQQFFKRANSKSPERGGAKKASIPQTAGERKAALVALRSRWADVQNEHLARYGHESRVDHRSLKEQGINRTPEVHLGPVQAAVSMVSRLLQSRNGGMPSGNSRPPEMPQMPFSRNRSKSKKSRQLSLFVQPVHRSYCFSTARL